jgi:hypothetical protein
MRIGLSIHLVKEEDDNSQVQGTQRSRPAKHNYNHFTADAPCIYV